MNSYFFGSSDKQLFGVYHPPASGEMRAKAVLVCHAFDHEYMRTHWAFRRLADRLGNEGFHVLRFDYFGTGDSAGESTEITLDQCRDDILTAAEELKEVSGAMQVSIVGLRLGAALAMTTNKLKTTDLILWEPVVSGQDYLREHNNTHQAFVEKFNKAIGVNRTIEPGESIGQTYSDEFREGLAELDCRQASPNTRNLVVITSPERAGHSESLAKVAEAQKIRYRHHSVDDVGQWDTMSSNSILPTATINTIVDALTGKTVT